MRAAQYKILTRVLERIPVPDYIHAFERGRSIPVMAQQHVGKGLVISLDLKDFFTSIKQRHLKQIFQHLGVADAPARTLSELCTYEAFVPQGALTSPKLSNIVSSLTFGPLVKSYCDERGYSVSIYADDITISCETDIVATGGISAAQDIVQAITNIVSMYGFRINRRKTKIMRPFQRQYVCGVVVNRKTNLQQKERRRLRAIIHNCRQNGIAHEAAKNNVTAETFVSRITGKLNWFAQLNDEQGSVMMEQFRSLANVETTEQDSTLTVPTDTPVVATTEVPWQQAT